MGNGNVVFKPNNSLETIPEETELPRISGLIPKSPETRKREKEDQQLFEQYSNDKRFETFYEMLIMNTNLKRICLSEKYFVGNYVDLRNVDGDGNASRRSSGINRNFRRKVK